MTSAGGYNFGQGGSVFAEKTGLSEKLVGGKCGGSKKGGKSTGAIQSKKKISKDCCYESSQTRICARLSKLLTEHPDLCSDRVRNKLLSAGT